MGGGEAWSSSCSTGCAPAWQGRQAACHPLSGARRIAARAVPPCARQAANAYLRSHSEAQGRGRAVCRKRLRWHSRAPLQHQERRVVLLADAAAEPVAVVVHPQHAAAAVGAVVAAARLVPATLDTGPALRQRSAVGRFELGGVARAGADRTPLVEQEEKRQAEAHRHHRQRHVWRHDPRPLGGGDGDECVHGGDGGGAVF